MMQRSSRKSKKLVRRSIDLRFPRKNLPACIRTSWLWWNIVGLRNRLRDLRLSRCPKHSRPSTKESQCYMFSIYTVF